MSRQANSYFLTNLRAPTLTIYSVVSRLIMAKYTVCVGLLTRMDGRLHSYRYRSYTPSRLNFRLQIVICVNRLDGALLSK